MKKRITEIEPKEIAKFAGLVYVNDQKPGIRRQLKNNHFVYIGEYGGHLSEIVCAPISDQLLSGRNNTSCREKEKDGRPQL